MVLLAKCYNDGVIMEEQVQKRNEYKAFVGKSEGKRLLELCIDMRII
jgi:hypothetical protein